MSPEDQQSTGDPQPRIVRGRFDSLSLYEVTEAELELLERGSPSSIYLNFGVFFASVGLSFFVALITTKIESLRVYTVFCVVAFIGVALGVILLAIWHRTRVSVAQTISKIRDRMPGAGDT